MMPGKYVLYGGGITRSVAVEVVLRELDLSYELVEIDTGRDEHRAADFLRINPAGFLPALVTPAGEALHENAAIMLWLAESHDSQDLAPPVHDPGRGLFLSKLFFHTNEIQPALKRYFFPSRYAPHPDSLAAVRAQAREAALARWQLLDDHLRVHGPFHLGDRFSLLDPHMAVWAIYGLESCDEVLERFPAIRRCFNQALQRPRSGGLLADFQRRVRHRQNTHSSTGGAGDSSAG